MQYTLLKCSLFNYHAYLSDFHQCYPGQSLYKELFKRFIQSYVKTSYGNILALFRSSQGTESLKFSRTLMIHATDFKSQTMQQEFKGVVTFMVLFLCTS